MSAPVRLQTFKAMQMKAGQRASAIVVAAASLPVQWMLQRACFRRSY
ncbi:hypothetical protein PQR66_06600 [Paraburkholderia agricolaris]|uniref:Uncharacterized protein n=1 Tax=Paraburkholderia agricolaris TaxID=2152888 RepID=A0ABW8ZK68_9BURK